MSAAFYVHTSPHFEHLARVLSKRYVELPKLLDIVIDILEADPYNESHNYAIRNLSGRQTDGQWRLRVGRWRFRYDILDRIVQLKVCGLRRGNTFR